MANPQILYKDLSIMVASSSAGTNTNYPLSNLNNYVENIYWSGSSVTPMQRLIFDIGESIPVSTVIIGGHNFTSIGADQSVRIQYADDQSFTTGVTNATGDIVTTDDTTIISTFNSVTKRYWALIFNSSVDLSVPPRVGNVFIGTPMEFTTAYENGFKTENIQHSTNTFTTLSGITRNIQTFNGRMIYEMKFRLQNEAFKTAYQNFIRTVRGKRYPFYFIDTDGTSVYYMLLDSDYNPLISQTYSGLYTIDSLKMRTQRSIY